MSGAFRASPRYRVTVDAGKAGVLSTVERANTPRKALQAALGKHLPLTGLARVTRPGDNGLEFVSYWEVTDDKTSPHRLTAEVYQAALRQRHTNGYRGVVAAQKEKEAAVKETPARIALWAATEGITLPPAAITPWLQAVWYITATPQVLLRLLEAVWNAPESSPLEVVKEKERYKKLVERATASYAYPPERLIVRVKE